MKYSGGVRYLSGSSQLPETGEKFRVLHRKVKREWVKVVEQSISASQALVLRHLQRRGRMKVSELAEAMLVSNGAVTALTDKLVAAGFAVRERAKDDRRVVYLAITQGGEAMLEEVSQRESELIDRLFAGLEPAELVTLSHMFGRMLDNLER